MDRGHESVKQVTFVVHVGKIMVETPRRFRNAKENASVGGTERRIERDYGLPRGSVDLRNPTGRAAKSNKRIGSLRDDWDD